jgi:hypothetical protein
MAQKLSQFETSPTRGLSFDISFHRSISTIDIQDLKEGLTSRASSRKETKHLQSRYGWQQECDRRIQRRMEARPRRKDPSTQSWRSALSGNWTGISFPLCLYCVSLTLTSDPLADIGNICNSDLLEYLDKSNIGYLTPPSPTATYPRAQTDRPSQKRENSRARR